MLACSFILLQTFWVMRNSAAIFFIQYVYGKAALAPTFLGLAFVSVIGNLSVPFLSKHFQNRHIMQFSLVLFVISQLLLPIAEKTQSVFFLFAGAIISLIAMGITFTIAFAMLSDTIDYSTKVLHFNETGFLSAVPMIGAKIGMGLGGFIASELLAVGGFNAKAATQSSGALLAINLTFIWIPIILGIGMFLMLQFYHLNEKALFGPAADTEDNTTDDFMEEEIE